MASTTAPLADAARRTLEGRRLLAHPFYRRWEAGELRDGELAAYGAQYAHVERQLPATLAALRDALPDGAARGLVAANLDDELHRPCAHVELLDSFLAAVGTTPAAPSAATAALTALYATAVERSAAFALGVVAAYELQAAEIARSKAEGLRRWYGLDDTGARFWDVHAELEAEHAQWTLGAAEDVDAAEVLAGVAVSSEAWWSFLDEREALAPSA
jgi:pyrroloquinoline-quinone synthase